MDSSTQQSTRGSARFPPSISQDDFFAEGSDSEHSFADTIHLQEKKNRYLSTSLVTARNITLADVITEELSRVHLTERIARATMCCKNASNSYGIVDPRAVYKKLKSK